MISPLIPHLTEKTYDLAKNLNVYVFKLDKALNTSQIKDRIQTEYDVEVVNLRTLLAKGKNARSIRLKSRATRRVLGRRKTVKKAYVTLKKGDVIPVFTDFTEKDNKPT